MADDLSQLPLIDLFRQELEVQAQVLNDGLLELERQPAAARPLEACMRAAHSIKGAARIVGLEPAVDIAHVLEDAFVAAQHGQLALDSGQIDLLLRAVDLLSHIADPAPQAPAAPELAAMLEALTTLTATGQAAPPPVAGKPPPAPAPIVEPEADPPPGSDADTTGGDRSLRVSAETLDRLLGLASEAMVSSLSLKPFADALLRVKRLQYAAGQALEVLHEAATVPGRQVDEHEATALTDARALLAECQHLLSERLGELDQFDRHSGNLARSLYDEALACRMRPFADGVSAYPRLVRDLGRSLGKQVRLQLLGQQTRVDRNILSQLDAPLGHLLRNALDHGIEAPAVRLQAGKPAEGTLTLEARHSAGVLLIQLSDDGAGIDLDALRAQILHRGLASAATIELLSTTELLDFLLLPGFSMRDVVTDISGRGVGLDVVHTMVKSVRGTLRITSEQGKGTRFTLQLPLTLSTVRSLLVDIGGEPYAFPLAHVERTLSWPRTQIEQLEGQPCLNLDGVRIGLADAAQILQLPAVESSSDEVAVVVIGEPPQQYGLVVDRFLSEGMLVVHPLDARLGKIPDIAAGALMDDGSPVLVVDVKDLLRSIEKRVAAGQLDAIRPGQASAAQARRKRVLVVDDSLTVRELQRKLLTGNGYEVAIAVDGMDGWNAIRTEPFDLLITDIDMPRMDGIELVGLVRQSAALKSLPVMILSYKDREEDRMRGLDAGADYYLAKGSFHDNTLLDAVRDLIGAAQ